MHKRKPGAPDTESNVEAALAAGQAGGTHKISKEHPNPGPSKVKGDPGRPSGAAVNMKPEMNYEQAMKRLEASRELSELKRLQQPTDAQRSRMAELAKIALTRNVLTPQGWVCVDRPPPPGTRI